MRWAPSVLMTTMYNALTAMFLCLVLTVTGCNVFLPSQFQSNRTGETAAEVSPASRAEFQAAWVGREASDVQKKFGPPSQMETLEDTGGKRYYYRESGQPHYVFEFNPHNKVISAAIGN